MNNEDAAIERRAVVKHQPAERIEVRPVIAHILMRAFLRYMGEAIAGISELN